MFDYDINEEYGIDFIKQEDFEAHVEKTINAYNETLNKIYLKLFCYLYIYTYFYMCYSI